MLEVRADRRDASRERRRGETVRAHGRRASARAPRRSRRPRFPCTIRRARRDRGGTRRPCAGNAERRGGAGSARRRGRGRRRTRRSEGFGRGVALPLRVATLGSLSPRAAVPLGVARPCTARRRAPRTGTRLRSSSLGTRRASGSRSRRTARSSSPTTRAGRLHRVLAWGAVNARRPDQARSQVGFGVDYSGGWGRFGRPVWRTLREHVRPVPRPRAGLARRRRAPRADGSHWALQRWRRSQANFGLRALEARPRRLRAPAFALERARRAARGVDRLELRRPLAPPLRPADATAASPSTASPRRRPAIRSTPTGASSTWTRSTRPTGRAGAARTASSRGIRTEASATGSSRIADRPASVGRPGTDAATASPRAARA